MHTITMLELNLQQTECDKSPPGASLILHVGVGSHRKVEGEEEECWNMTALCQGLSVGEGTLVPAP